MSLVGEEAVVPDLSDCLGEGGGADVYGGTERESLGALVPPALTSAFPNHCAVASSRAGQPAARPPRGGTRLEGQMMLSTQTHPTPDVASFT